MKKHIPHEELTAIKEKLRVAEETLQAIQKGEVDAVVVKGPQGDQIYSKENTQVVNILESITDGFFALDTQWHLSYINKRAEPLIGNKREAVLGKNIWEKLQKSLKEQFYPKFHKAISIKQTIAFEVYIAHLQAWFQVRVYPSKEGVSVYFSDITERKELERRKDEFISIASHELKTPLTSMWAFTQLLQRYMLRTKNEKGQMYISKVQTQLDRLTTLVNDLLDVSKIEAGKIVFAKDIFNFDDFVTTTIDEIQHTSPKHKIVKKGTVDVDITADRYRIGEVVTNLLTNAIKYSPDAQEVHVLISATADTVQVAVRDFGMGIPQTDMEKIFQRFYRVDGKKRESYPGLGLGLYISAEIVKRHKGKIWVESKEGVGTTFFFSLPIISKY